jgi:hypothetical protein
MIELLNANVTFAGQTHRLFFAIICITVIVFGGLQAILGKAILGKYTEKHKKNTKLKIYYIVALAINLISFSALIVCLIFNIS